MRYFCRPCSTITDSGAMAFSRFEVQIQAAAAPSSASRKRCLSNVPSRGGSTNGSRTAATLMTARTGPGSLRSSADRVRQPRLVGRGHRLGEARRLRHRRDVDGRGRVGFLHAGLAVALVVDDGDGEIGRPPHRDRRERADAHQHLAVAGHHQHAALRLRQRQAEPDHRRTAHRAPEIEVERMVARRGAIVCRRAEAADDQQVAAIGEQGGNDLTAPERAVARHRLNP